MLQENNSSNFILTIELGELKAINIRRTSESYHIQPNEDLNKSNDNFINNDELEDNILEEYMD